MSDSVSQTVFIRKISFGPTQANTLYLQLYYVSFIEPCEKISIQFLMKTVKKKFVSWANHTRSDLHQIRFRVPVNKRNLN